jgi:hypothetical protein
MIPATRTGSFWSSAQTLSVTRPRGITICLFCIALHHSKVNVYCNRLISCFMLYCQNKKRPSTCSIGLGDPCGRDPSASACQCACGSPMLTLIIAFDPSCHTKQNNNIPHIYSVCGMLLSALRARPATRHTKHNNSIPHIYSVCVMLLSALCGGSRRRDGWTL